MEELSWFWSGAVTLPVAPVVEALAARGGLGDAEACGVDALVALGAAPEMARAWRGSRPVATSSC